MVEAFGSQTALVLLITAAGWLLGWGRRGWRRAATVAGALALAVIDVPKATLAGLLALAVARWRPRAGGARPVARGIVLAALAVGMLRADYDALVRPWPPATMANAANAAGLVQQTTGTTCVAASGAMLLDRAGLRATEGQVARAARVSHATGADLWALARGLNRWPALSGRRAVCSPLSYDRLMRLGRPVVVGFWLERIQLYHAVLVEQATPDRVIYADPLGARQRTMSRAELTANWMPLGVWLD
jgi:hypothetical protein